MIVKVDLEVRVLSNMSIYALSPLDGRYLKDTSELGKYFSEWALMKYRVKVEVKWLIFMSRLQCMKEVRRLEENELVLLKDIVHNFDKKTAQKIKEIEKTTSHDVKAVEYFLKDTLKRTSLNDIMEFIHFGCTSEDINNLAYAMMLKDGIINAWLVKAWELVGEVSKSAIELKECAILARTHGQPASPTTMGKELAVFVSRWKRQLKHIENLEFLGKFSGVTGNFNAQLIAYSEFDWEKIACDFVEGLGIKYNPLTTQIEAHDYMAECFHAIIRFNNILLDFDRDMWSYISMNYFKQRVVEGEVGSSTMPHKVNPIKFEASEANIGLSNAIMGHLADKLPVSRLQRDLSDSSALRNIGTAIGHSYIAVKFAMTGFSKLIINKDQISNELDTAWEVLAEAVQTVMRKCGYEKPYEKLKELTRGRSITEKAMREFINSLELPDEDKKRLMKLTPAQYTGIAGKLAEHARD